MKTNNHWKWFFAIVITLALFTAISLIWWNLRLQLKPEELEAAHTLWDAAGPKSYTLVYTESFTSRTDAVAQSNHYVVKVRDRSVTEVIVNGLPKTEGLDYHGMDGLFKEVEGFQDKDDKEKRKVYRRASFDGQSGAILLYIRRVMGSSERQEIRVESLTPR